MLRKTRQHHDLVNRKVTRIHTEACYPDNLMYIAIFHSLIMNRLFTPEWMIRQERDSELFG